jgi:hypothetical protein
MKKCIFISTLFILFFSCKKESVELDRVKFIGVYSVNESCPNGASNYEIIITNSSESDNAVLLTNFGGLAGLTVKAIVNGSNIILPNQTIAFNGLSIIINGGSGSINGLILNLNYGFSIGIDSQNCSMSCNKK